MLVSLVDINSDIYNFYDSWGRILPFKVLKNLGPFSCQAKNLKPQDTIRRFSQKCERRACPAGLSRRSSKNEDGSWSIGR